MNCPNCGAALEPLPNRSHFRCDYCKSLHFPEPEGEGVILLDKDHPLACPCCDRSLAAAVLDGDTVGHCQDCRGILLSSDHFARVVARRRETSGLQHKVVEPIDPKEFRRVTKCPKCRKRLDTHTYGGGGNTVIDSCYRCRLVWLDAGELTALGQVPVKPGQRDRLGEVVVLIEGD
jgi:Zn-finger nucleic acid-binding protein